MKTVVIKINNNGLKHDTWIEMLCHLDASLTLYSVSFFGLSLELHSLQQACWIVNVEDINSIKELLKGTDNFYMKIKIEIIVGETEYITV